MKLSLILILSIMGSTLTPGVLLAQNDLIEQLDRIKKRPKKVRIQNKIDIEDEGGHLQGIQAYQYQGKTYYYMSGSSSSYGYLVVADTEETQRLHMLEYKPLKHAGGFQIKDNWLAVGVEDNEARNTSEVQVFRLDNPMNINLEPVALIARNGEWERATAGAVAIHAFQDRLMVVVGDWSNRHIDFYHAPLSNDHNDLRFEKTGEIDLINYPKEEWIDKNAWPYQNINIISDDEKIYLFGFGSGPKDKNLMDVFLLEENSASQPVLKKIYHRTFGKSRHTRFRWGAGVSYHPEKGFSIYTCGESILEEAKIWVYTSKE